MSNQVQIKENKSGEGKMINSIFGKTVQAYTASGCGMGCGHCRLWLQKAPDMSLKIFEDTIHSIRSYRVERFEFFANEPLMNPGILDQVGIVNDSGLEFAILTVGSSRTDSGKMERLFEEVANKIDRKKGGFVFSVDFLPETAKRILSNGQGELWPYAYKADVFWRRAPWLIDQGIPVRTNTVVSSHNIDEAVNIMEMATALGFASSCCFVQTIQPEFIELQQYGLTLKIEQRFRDFLLGQGLLSEAETELIITESSAIISGGEAQNGISSPFNKFRGTNPEEAEVDLKKLERLRRGLLNLKTCRPGKFLPDINFIEDFGSKGFGCMGLLKQGRFPQLKVGPMGQMRFCCDMFDQYTESYRIGHFYDHETRAAFLRMIRTNPYIWICLYFNPCSWSVNYVDYQTLTK